MAGTPFTLRGSPQHTGILTMTQTIIAADHILLLADRQQSDQ
jgi:hypothetical protein